MINRRLDWLQPEQLEARWRETPAADAPAPSPPPAAPVELDDPLAWCARLRELGRARFAEGAPILRVLAELCRLVEQRFAPEASPDAELDAAIVEYVGYVEDLADVAALGGRR